MKLPEQMPDELLAFLKQRFNLEMREFYALAEVYEATADYFNNHTTKWYPVSEKPEHDCDVWLWDGQRVILGDSNFNPQQHWLETYPGYEDVSISPDFKPTRWAYAHLQEPPKE